MPSLPDHSAELALLGCVLLNGAVVGSARRFVGRRVTASPSQAWLDTVLLTYTVQYAAIGLPGVVGLLRPWVVIAVALAAAVTLWLAAGGRRIAPPLVTRGQRAAVVAIAAFIACVVVGFAYNQADLPVLFNDALTYHFPAAAQWLQQGRIGLFPTWFFNPANTYSPLAGSTFIAWLMMPFGSDVLARFVQVPALLAVGLGVYRLARELSAGPIAAAAGAAAAVFCRPLFTACLTGKDDLFVAFAFVAAIVALAPARSAEPFGAARLGLAVGLLLATKYTALLAVPLLVLSVDGARRWSPRRWAAAVAVATAMAAPWYARNWAATGNPLFPLDLSAVGLHGLFTTARSAAFVTLAADVRIVLGGSYGVPVTVAVVAAAGWLTALVRRPWVRDPIWRACVVGPPLGVALFFWRSPFPEVRFVFPAVLLLLAAAVGSGPWIAGGLAFAAVATVTVSRGWELFGPLMAVAAVGAGLVLAGDAVTRRGWQRAALAAVPVVGLSLFAYVRWSAFCRTYPDHWTVGDVAWSVQYPGDQTLWQCVNRQAAADASVAYADLYFVYPLQGPGLRRRIGYAPVRRGVHTPADLPWLGGHLSGERLVAAADAATVADPDLPTWLGNLRRLGAEYLVVGRSGPGPAVEITWADADPRHFRPLYAGPAGRVYAVDLAD